MRSLQLLRRITKKHKIITEQSRRTASFLLKSRTVFSYLDLFKLLEFFWIAALETFMKIYENNHRYSHSFVVEYMHEVNRMNWLTELETYKDAFIQDLRGLIAILLCGMTKQRQPMHRLGQAVEKHWIICWNLGKEKAFR